VKIRLTIKNLDNNQELSRDYQFENPEDMDWNNICTEMCHVTEENEDKF